MIRYANVGDPQRYFDESVAGTAIAHLAPGSVRSARRDEAGFEAEAGHKQMWFARPRRRVRAPGHRGRDGADARTHGHRRPGARRPTRRGPPSDGEARVFADLDLDFEMLIQRMINILLIEISAFHTFAWAETVLSDPDLVAGDGAAAGSCRISARTRRRMSST